MSEVIRRDVLQGFRALVVDDEPDAAKVCELLLKRSGVEVLVAVNGLQGLEFAREQKPEFILSDLSMPEMSGYQLVMELKKDPMLATIPILAITAHVMSGNRERALAAGFDEYLTKPLRPRVFIHDLIIFLRRFPHLVERLPDID
ncbi:MAG TPA: response regulator [Phototrophicaceae bacterium]|jgi:CheY-like chemotaxis protein|nr:response regulator [Phototrophicaceae bacterium]